MAESGPAPEYRRRNAGMLNLAVVTSCRGFSLSYGLLQSGMPRSYGSAIRRSKSRSGVQNLDVNTWFCGASTSPVTATPASKKGIRFWYCKSQIWWLVLKPYLSLLHRWVATSYWILIMRSTGGPLAYSRKQNDPLSRMGPSGIFGIHSAPYCPHPARHPLTWHSSNLLAVDSDLRRYLGTIGTSQSARFGISRKLVRAPALDHRPPRRLCAESIRDSTIGPYKYWLYLPSFFNFLHFGVECKKRP
ncbi:hypothetical protein B0H15DRAFT_807855 [Mycena belliarum]|uniref:Uncharacterized protein n=1 Tax=Mycena belliarum TaxID=1033014 RepID=A0AAD6TKH3_9AGAR|nr:hypothetical protein B0H15DRAFT_807855 [Mycena belliae]